MALFFFFNDFREETGTDAQKVTTQTQFGGAEVARDILDSGFIILQRFIVSEQWTVVVLCTKSRVRDIL